MVTHIKVTNQDISNLTATLEDLGLSAYEAKAYIALVRKGSLPIGELAYYAGIPRTKAYTTVKKLANKKLILILPSKPIRCQIVPMKDSFEQILSQEERRLRRLKRAILKLKRFSEELKFREGANEVTHTNLGGQAILAKLTQIIQGVRRYIHCIVDGWGFKLLQDAFNQFKDKFSTNIDFKILLSLSVDNVKNYFPSNVKLRISHHIFRQSVFISDDTQLLIVDGGRGTGLFIQSNELYSILEFELFEKYWRDSFPIKDVIPFLNTGDISDLINLVKNYRVYELFARSVLEVVKDGTIISEVGLKFIEKLKEEFRLKSSDECLESFLRFLISLPHKNSVLETQQYDGFELRNSPSIWAIGLLGLLKKNEEHSYDINLLEQDIIDNYQKLAT